MNKSTGNAQFYRFASPKSKEYPYMIEIFSRNPDFIILEDDAVLTPLPIDDEISSLSAILLNEAYYELLKTGQMMVDGIPVLSPTCLIPFKAKAWLDLKERKLNGEQVDSKNIKKMPLANICGHGDVQVPTRDVVIKCCKKAGLKVENFEIRKGMRMHCVVRKPMGKAIGNER